MDKSLRLQLLFTAAEKVSGPIKRIQAASRGMAGDLAASTAELRKLDAAQKDIAGFRTLKKELVTTEAALKKQRIEVARLKGEMGKAAEPSAKLARELNAASKSADRMAATASKQRTRLDQLRGSLADAGVSTTRLNADQRELAQRMTAANAAIERQKGKLAALDRARATGERLKSAGGTMAATGAGMTAGVTAPIVAVAAMSIAAANESAAAMGQVNAALESTKGAVQRSSEQLSKQAEVLQKLSTYDDDDILRDLTTRMLFFGKVTGPTFDRAQLAAVNFAAKMKTELGPAAQFVGKALNDPIKGLALLRKKGIDFTAQQEAQVKAMVKAGNVAGAQAILLGELEEKVGGAAKAMRDATPNAGLTNAWDNLQETIGAKLLPHLTPLVEKLGKLIEKFTEMPDWVVTTVLVLAALAAVVGPVLMVIGPLVIGLGMLTTATAGLGIALTPLALIIAAVAIVLAALVALWFYWDDLMIEAKIAVGALAVGMMPLQVASRLLLAAWNLLSDGLKTVIAALGLAIGGIINPFNTVLNLLLGLVPKFGTYGRNIINGLINGITSAIPRLLASMNPVWGIGATFAKKLAIKSPSRVFMALGGHVTDGLAIGIQRGTSAPLSRMNALAGGLVGAAALTVAAPGLAFGGAAAGGGGGAGGGAPGGFTINAPITINAAPGQSAESIGIEVARQLQAREREAAARWRSGFRDD